MYTGLSLGSGTWWGVFELERSQAPLFQELVLYIFPSPNTCCGEDERFLPRSSQAPNCDVCDSGMAFFVRVSCLPY